MHWPQFMKTKMLLTVLSVLISFHFFSCSNNATLNDDKKSLSLANIDPSIEPGDNFFLYANGNWLKSAEIPPTESSVGANLEMYDRTIGHLRAILEECSKANNLQGGIEQKVGDFYASGMDSVAIERLSDEPLKPYLQKINTLSTAEEILHFVAEQTTYNNSVLIGQAFVPDEKNSTTIIATYYQSGLGLPDRDYYFRTDSATKAVVKAYQTYMNTIFILTGDDTATAAKNMTSVYELESKMAESHKTNVELRDPQANYNKMAVADLDIKMPNIHWKELLHRLFVNADSVNISQPAYYSTLNDLFKTIPIDTWTAYLRFHVANNAAGYLSSNFAEAKFEYEGRALSGQQQITERWERIYTQIDNNLGEALGQLYVKKYFKEGAKKRILDLVNNIQKACEARIDKLDWMNDSTKQKAKEKLSTMSKKIGYPDKWRDYSKVIIDKNKYFDNLIACGKNEYSYQVNKVGKPVDRTEWSMTPPTLDAYYNPESNEIVFPAGILQYPMFDVDVDDAMNYGGIGFVIGHETTHAFDDQGAQYDKDGNLKNWWSKEDYAKFSEKGKRVVEMYNSLIVLDSVHLNGSLTEGENIADIGGLAIAYDAFKMTKQGLEGARLDSFTPDQRFFLSFAQCWRRKGRDAALRKQINTNPHSPAMYRVNGPLMNFDPFYASFQIKENNKMFLAKEDRVKIW